MFTPRSTDEITQSLAARIVARSPLSDLAESSVVLALTEAWAEELAGIEFALAKLRDSFNFLDPDISETDFDARLAELPGNALTRLPATTAAGGVVTLSRAAGDAADALVVPAGAVFRRVDDPTMLYRTTQSYTLGIGVASIAGVHVVCLTRGAVGNCAAGAISVIVAASARIVAVTNTAPLTSGIDAETVPQAQARLAGYFAGLSVTVPQAQEYLALSFTSVAGVRLRFAKVYQDWLRPGYAELIVDDGTGLLGLTRPGATSSGIVSASGQTFLWHEMPATTPIESVAVVLAGGGNKTLTLAGGDFVSLPEKGLVVVSETALAVGDTWTISGYSVRTGILAEIQAAAEGDPSDGANTPGWIACGCRLAVRPPDVVPVYFDLHCVPRSFVDLAEVLQQAVNDTISYVASLAPGEPLFVARLIDALLTNADLLNVHVYLPGTATPAADVYVKPHQALRTDSTKIGTIASLPGS